jgi:hypothetical protein
MLGNKSTSINLVHKYFLIITGWDIPISTSIHYLLEFGRVTTPSIVLFGRVGWIILEKEEGK